MRLALLLLLTVLCVSVRGDPEADSSSCGSELLKGVDIPAAIQVPSGQKLRAAYYAEGLQHYFFNGSAWVLFNATATLYTVDEGSNGSSRKLLGAAMKKKELCAVGQHFFLGHPDPKGGQPSWETTVPAFSLVTGVSLQAVTVDPQSITWSLFQATAHSGSSDLLGAVTYLQRIAAKGGLPPTSAAGAQLNQIHLTPYSIIYAFYVQA